MMGYQRYPNVYIVDVAEIRGVPGRRLLRHPLPTRALDEDELGTVDVVGFHDGAVPGGRLAPAGRTVPGVLLFGQWSRR